MEAPPPILTSKRAYLKSERFYFPALGHRPVSENNLFVFCVSRPPRVGLCTPRIRDRGKSPWPRGAASCCMEMYAHDTGMLDVVPK